MFKIKYFQWFEYIFHKIPVSQFIFVLFSSIYITSSYNIFNNQFYILNFTLNNFSNAPHMTICESESHSSISKIVVSSSICRSFASSSERKTSCIFNRICFLSIISCLFIRSSILIAFNRQSTKSS